MREIVQVESQSTHSEWHLGSCVARIRAQLSPFRQSSSSISLDFRAMYLVPLAALPPIQVLSARCHHCVPSLIGTASPGLSLKLEPEVTTIQERLGMRRELSKRLGTLPFSTPTIICPVIECCRAGGYNTTVIDESETTAISACLSGLIRDARGQVSGSIPERYNSSR